MPARPVHGSGPADSTTRWSRGWAPLAVTLLAAFLRLWHLGKPHAFAFDETYYAKDAWSLLHLGYSQNYVDKANDADPRRSHRPASGPATPRWWCTPRSASG